jgi:hypothetical protein
VTRWVEAFVAGGTGHGAFLSSCGYHCDSGKNMWGSIQIGGDNAAAAFASWYHGGELTMALERSSLQSSHQSSLQSSLQRLWNQDMRYPCPTCCSVDGEAIQALHDQQQRAQTGLAAALGMSKLYQNCYGLL